MNNTKVASLQASLLSVFETVCKEDKGLDKTELFILVSIYLSLEVNMEINPTVWTKKVEKQNNANLMNLLC